MSAYPGQLFVHSHRTPQDVGQRPDTRTFTGSQNQQAQPGISVKVRVGSRGEASQPVTTSAAVETATTQRGAYVTSGFVTAAASMCVCPHRHISRFDMQH